MHKELIEAIASNDESLMEKYFDKGELDEDEMKAGMKKAMINHDLFPLFCISAERNMGSGRLMGFIDNVCPSANEMPPNRKRVMVPYWNAMIKDRLVFLFIKQFLSRMWARYLISKCIPER